MASINTREAVANYERSRNALVRAVSPGGILCDATIAGHPQALLVPREIMLRVYALAPFLLLSGHPPYGDKVGTAGVLSRTPPPLSIGDNGVEGAGGPIPDSFAQETVECLKVQEQLRDITAEQHHRIRSALRHFLQYHLLTFDPKGNVRFKTARGDSGEFSETLDSVIRFGRLGKVNVVTYMEPIHSPTTAGVSDAGVAAAAPPAGHPTTLPMYVIDELLMDAEEVQALRAELQDALRAAESAPDLGEVHSRSAPTFVTPTLSGCLAAPPPPSRERVMRTRYNGVEKDSTTAAGEEEEEEDVVVEEDYTAFLDKTTRRERLQREREEAAMARAPHIAHTNPSQQAMATAPAASSGAHAAQRRASQASAPVLQAHVNVMTHQYSKESISDYRRIVAPDNEIGYEEFKSHMKKEVCFPLARLVSNFIEAAQMRSRGLRDNRSFLVLMDAMEAEMDKIPAIHSHPHRRVTILEGTEKHVTSKLYFRLFNIDERERAKNTSLQERLQALGRLTATDLDALEDVERHHVWGQAMFELDGMNFFKSPREKLRCGMRAGELLSLAVGEVLAQRKQKRANHREASGKESSSPQQGLLAFGADEFLPCFMLLVLRAQPYNYYQNIQYIDKFRLESLRSPEESYCLANMLSAAEFWLHCDDRGRCDSSSRNPSRVQGAAGDMTGPNGAGPTAGPGGAVSHQQPHHTSNAPPESPLLAKAIGKDVAAAVRQGTVVAMPPPPVMREGDMLPSLRQSRSHRQTAAMDGVVLRRASASEEATTSLQPANMMDRLFWWAKPSEGAESEPRGVEGKRRSLGRGTGDASSGAANPPGDGTAATMPLLSMLGMAGPQRPPGAPPKPISVAQRVLVDQAKRFEDLTQEELRAIVEEARAACKAGTEAV